MTSAKPFDDPTNRVVCIFDVHNDAQNAKAALIEFGFDKDRVRILHGRDAAEKVDTSAKWFADTDEEMKRFDRELRAGNSVLSVSVDDCDCREQVHAIVSRHNARHVTHFGEWITEVMR